MPAGEIKVIRSQHQIRGVGDGSERCILIPAQRRNHRLIDKPLAFENPGSMVVPGSDGG
jgi:hypothetical protein